MIKMGENLNTKNADKIEDRSKIVSSQISEPEYYSQQDTKGEISKEFGLGSFLKIITFSILTLLTALLFGLKLRVIIDNPFFFFSINKELSIQLLWLLLSFILFVTFISLTILITASSFIEFIPAWLLGGVALFIGLGNYETAGIAISVPFLILILIYYLLVQSDMKNSLAFSVRQAFSSLSMFLMMTFLVVCTGYYFSCLTEFEKVKDSVPEAIIKPIYEYERKVVASQLGVEEDKIESELYRLRKQGTTAKIGGALGFIDITDVQEGIDNLYNVTKKQLSNFISPYYRWIGVGLSLFLLLTLAIISTPLAWIIKIVLWLFIELLVSFRFLRRVKEVREVTTLAV
jgi:hypothetical protein